MAKSKRRKPSVDMLTDLESRLRQFIDLNNIAIGNNVRPEYLDGQNVGFQTVITLIGQLRKSGSIWRGGYNDATGKVIYGDQVQSILDEHEAAQIELALDDELQQRLDREP